jgi:hypothetical protein
VAGDRALEGQLRGSWPSGTSPGPTSPKLRPDPPADPGFPALAVRAPVTRAARAPGSNFPEVVPRDAVRAATSPKLRGGGGRAQSASAGPAWWRG